MFPPSPVWVYFFFVQFWEFARGVPRGKYTNTHIQLTTTETATATAMGLDISIGKLERVRICDYFDENGEWVTFECNEEPEDCRSKHAWRDTVDWDEAWSTAADDRVNSKYNDGCTMPLLKNVPYRPIGRDYLGEFIKDFPVLSKYLGLPSDETVLEAKEWTIPISAELYEYVTLRLEYESPKDECSVDRVKWFKFWFRLAVETFGDEAYLDLEYY
jgi:hypothetical protein